MDSALRSHRTPINILQTQVDVLTWDYSMYNVQYTNDTIYLIGILY